MIKMSMAVAALVLATWGGLAQDNRGGQLRATLSGFAEVPAISTRGAGEFTAEVDANGIEIKYTLRYENLEGGAVTAARIHFGQAGVMGNVVVQLCGVTGKPACTSSPLSGTIRSGDVIAAAGQGIAAGEFAELLQAVRAGATYVNVTTPAFPGGEIRGQIRAGRGPQKQRDDGPQDDQPGRGRGRGPR